MSTDVSRPSVHFAAREGWINDPLGLTYHGGRYHLFFQYVPGRTQWAPDQRWGHATSEDLLHWSEEPVALAPGDGDGGIWSGSIAVPQEGPATLFYTAVDLDRLAIGRVRVARPADDTWTTWVKGDVVAQLPAEVDAIAFRDPYVLHDGTCWRMLMGAGLADGTAAALTYRSDDGDQWSYDGVLAGRHRDETEPLWTGEGWECPQLFRLGDTWVLTFSVWEPAQPHHQVYAVGDLRDGRFVARSWRRLTYGPSTYAGAAYTDADGQPGLIFWLRGVDDPAGRWASAHSLPHSVRLDGAWVIAEPHPAVERARRGEAVVLRDGEAGVSGPCDVVLTLDDAGSRACVAVDGEVVRLAVADRELTATTGSGAWTMPVGGTSVRAVLDGPVLEIFTTHGTMALPVPSVSPDRMLAVAGAASARVWALA